VESGVKGKTPAELVGVDALGDPPEWGRQNTHLATRTVAIHPL